MQPTLKAALLVATGRSAFQVVTPSVAALVENGVKTMTTAKLKIATALLLATSLIGGVGWAIGQRPDEKPEPVNPEPRAKSGKPSGDLYGEPLPPEAVACLGTTRLRHGENIDSLHFMPDGKVLVGRGNGGVRTWAVATGNRIHLFPKESEGGLPAGASLSPDGKLLATPGEKSLRIWETATAKLLRTIDIDTGRSIRGQCLFTCFSADGKMLASQNGDQLNQVTLWDPATGRHMRTWTAGERWITFLAFAGDDKTLITANDANSISAWDVATGKQEREIASFPNPLKTLALSPDRKLLAIVGYIKKPRGPVVVPAGAGIDETYLPEPFIHI
jgi:WD40 repeat protein